MVVVVVYDIFLLGVGGGGMGLFVWFLVLIRLLFLFIFVAIPPLTIQPFFEAWFIRPVSPLTRSYPRRPDRGKTEVRLQIKL